MTLENATADDAFVPEKNNDRGDAVMVVLWHKVGPVNRSSQVQFPVITKFATYLCVIFRSLRKAREGRE